MLDKNRLAKVLALTQSENDAEALAASRKANEIIKGEGLTWPDVFTATVNITLQRTPVSPEGFGPVAEEWIPPHLKDAHVINVMFQTIYAQPRTDNEGFWQFLDSIHHQWTQHQALKQNQYQALRRSYNFAIKAARA